MQRLDRQRLRQVADRYGSVIILLMVVLAFAVLEPRYFLSAANFNNVGRQASVLLILALGQLLAVATAGVDLSVGSVMSLSMIVMALVMEGGALDPSIVPAVAPLVGLLCGLVNGLGIIYLRLPHPFIMTLAMLYIARGATNLLSGGVPISGMPEAVRWFGSGELNLGMRIPVPLVVAFAAYLVIGGVLRFTRFGLQVYAVGGSETGALYAGVSISKVKLGVYGLCGMLAGLAGLILAGRTNSAYPNAGIGAELDAIAAVIIGGASFFGGRGNAPATFAGALMITIFRNGLNLADVTVFWQQVLIGVIVIGAVGLDVLRGRWLRKVAFD